MCLKKYLAVIKMADFLHFHVCYNRVINHWVAYICFIVYAIYLFLILLVHVFWNDNSILDGLS